MEPITPTEALVQHGQNIHPTILQIVNTLLSQRFVKINTTVKITQEEIVTEFLRQHPEFDRPRLFKEHHLDFEEVYRQAGWKVSYDKPGYNESYGAYYEFSTAIKPVTKSYF